MKNSVSFFISFLYPLEYMEKESHLFIYENKKESAIKKEVKKMLTPKQEKFCQCIVSGMSGKDAYIAAYDHHGGDRTAYNEANLLLKRNDITKRIKELQVPLINHAINTAISEREKIKNKLWEIINNSDTNDSDKIRAMDILNKMNAEYINIQRVEHDNSMETVDTDKLIEITRLA